MPSLISSKQLIYDTHQHTPMWNGNFIVNYSTVTHPLNTLLVNCTNSYTHPYHTYLNGHFIMFVVTQSLNIWSYIKISDIIINRAACLVNISYMTIYSNLAYLELTTFTTVNIVMLRRVHTCISQYYIMGHFILIHSTWDIFTKYHLWWELHN